MAKMYASDVAMWATVEGVTQIYEGTNEIMRVVVARNLLGKR